MSRRNRRVRRGDDDDDDSKSVDSFSRTPSRDISEDGGSVASFRSNDRTAENSDGEEEHDAEKDVEFNVKQHMDNLLEKSGQTRESSLSSLKDIFCKNVLSEFLLERKTTLMESLKRSFRKGSARERELAADVVALAVLQLGVELEGDFQDIREPLLETLFDRTGATDAVRAAAARALGIGSFVTDDIAPSVEIMDKLAEVFGRKPATGTLPAAAVESWALLLTRIPSGRLRAIFDRQFKPLVSLLDADSLELRVNAGEALALLFESVRDDGHIDENGEENGEDGAGGIADASDMAVLCDKLQALATESGRHIGKKERAKQRSNFRDILYAVERGQAPEETLKFRREKIVLDSWAQIIQSAVFRDILGEGMKVHFEENEFIRDVFGMGAPLGDETSPAAKLSAQEKRKYMSPNSDLSKARSRARQKNRDKRMVV
eukprot:Opistho-1_new@19753